MSTADYAGDAVRVQSLEEVLHLVQDTGKPAEALASVVRLIAKRFEADVCSVYLLEPDRGNLVLAATVGLRPQCIGTLRMALNEGLAGLVAEEVYPIAVERVSSGYLAAAVQGSLAAVRSAVEAGSQAVRQYGELRAAQVYPKPHAEAGALLDNGTSARLQSGIAALESGGSP